MDVSLLQFTLLKLMKAQHSNAVPYVAVNAYALQTGSRALPTVRASTEIGRLAINLPSILAAYSAGVPV